MLDVATEEKTETGTREEKFVAAVLLDNIMVTLATRIEVLFSLTIYVKGCQCQITHKSTKII